VKIKVKITSQNTENDKSGTKLFLALHIFNLTLEEKVQLILGKLCTPFAPVDGKIEYGYM
jgi:hypothetical protein